MNSLNQWQRREGKKTGTCEYNKVGVRLNELEYVRMRKRSISTSTYRLRTIVSSCECDFGSFEQIYADIFGFFLLL